MKYCKLFLFLIMFSTLPLAQPDSSNSFWAQIGTGFNITGFSDSNIGSNFYTSLNYEFQNNVISISYMNSNELFSFNHPGENIKSYQLKYGKSFDFTLRGLILPFPMLLIIKKDFNYSIITRIGFSYNEVTKRTSLLKEESFGDYYNSKLVPGFGIPIEFELREDITNFLGMGISILANISKVSNYNCFSFNLYVGKF